MSTAPDGNGAAGTPGDAVAAFLQVAGGAAEHVATEHAGDPRVMAAFTLGWQMAELYRVVTSAPDDPSERSVQPSPPTAPAEDARVESDPPANLPAGDASTAATIAPGRSLTSLPRSSGDLPGLGKMTPAQRDHEARMIIDSALTRLATPVTAAGLTLPSPQLVGRCVTGSAGVRAGALGDLHVELRSTLGAADVRIGRAYALGCALSDTCNSPRDAAGLRKRLKPSKVARLRTALDDLASAFPPHAASVVNKTLCRWSEALWPAPPSTTTRRRHGGHPAPPPLLGDADLLTYAARQGQMWRALLAGDKRGEDMLRPADYVQAAGLAAGQMRTLTRRLITRFPLLTLVVLTLFGGGVALMLLVSGSGSIAAGTVTMLTGLGITWKGVGAAAGRVEQHLWGAELDVAIANATFMLAGETSTGHERRRLARQTAEDPGEVEGSNETEESPSQPVVASSPQMPVTLA